jgi:hypothetical protein
MKELTDEDALQQMNENYKSFLTSEGKESKYAPFAKVDNKTQADYCSLRFSGKLDDQNRHICMELIGQPLGAEECLQVPENQHNRTETYHFSYYSKYLCLHWKSVEVDETPYKCMFDWADTADYDFFIRDGDSYDMPFVTINECLKAYDTTPDTEMNLKSINGLEIYT